MKSSFAISSSGLGGRRQGGHSSASQVTPEQAEKVREIIGSHKSVTEAVKNAWHFVKS